MSLGLALELLQVILMRVQKPPLLTLMPDPGTYVYYCAVLPTAMHIDHGAFGLIVVEEGFSDVKHEFYLIQS